MLVLCHSILKKEINPLLKYFSIEDLRKAAIKAKNGLGIEIKGSNYPGTKLYKIYLTGKVAGRSVFLLLIKEQKVTPVFLRLKNDKIIGENISIKNKVFANVLNKYLDLIMTDLKESRFEKIDI